MSSFSQFYSSKDGISSKRGCFESVDCAGSERTTLSRSENRSDLDNGGHRDGTTDDRLVPFSPLKLDTEAAVQRHRRLPVIPTPRFPAAILSAPSLASILAPSASIASFFHNITPLTSTPFSLPLSIDFSTSVPPSSQPLVMPPAPLPLLSFYHPAFWGSMPYLIGRAPVQEHSTFGCQSLCSFDNDLSSLCPTLCQTKSRDARVVRRLFCDTDSQRSDASFRPSLHEAASSRLEDMAKMVSRLDDAKN